MWKKLCGVLIVAGCGSYAAQPFDAGLLPEDAGLHKDADPSVDASSVDGAADAPPGVPCGGKACPARMVCVPVSGAPFCIDAWEASRAEYEEAMTTAPIAGQDARCQWNQSYLSVPPAIGPDPALPVVGIDWCDALAYCKQKGKRLCRTIGGGKDGTGPEQEWYLACSGLATKLFPYGNTSEPDACVLGKGAGDKSLVRPTGTKSTCEGGVPGLYEMLGNVHEWVDREPDRGDAGYTRLDYVSFAGGGWSQIASDTCLTFTLAFTFPRDNPAGDIGVRCCADPR
jgi:formylglycine-generating enzyme